MKVWAQGKGDVPADCQVDFNRFIKGLGVRTEWKNSTSGDIGDIKMGVLYLVIAPSNRKMEENLPRPPVTFRFHAKNTFLKFSVW